MFTQKSGSGEYYWEVFKPIRDAQTVLKLPESAIQKSLGVHHYEICHMMRCHYDIITLSDGLRPIEPPHIEPQHSYLEIYVHTIPLRLALLYMLSVFSILNIIFETLFCVL